jgi:hypothetical protein
VLPAGAWNYQVGGYASALWTGVSDVVNSGSIDRPKTAFPNVDGLRAIVLERWERLGKADRTQRGQTRENDHERRDRRHDTYARHVPPLHPSRVAEPRASMALERLERVRKPFYKSAPQPRFCE